MHEHRGKIGWILQITSDTLPKSSLIVSGGSIALAMILVVTGVIGREIFNISMPFAIEFSEYLIPVACYWGAAYTLSVDGHVNADVVVNRLSERTREWLLFIGYLLGMPYLFSITFQLLKVVLVSFRDGYVSMYPLQTPLWIPQLLVWIGLFMFDLQLIAETVKKAHRLFCRPKEQP